MASVQQTGKASGKRSLDADINLVPFIDLLSMCICFLLMTAVWIQVGSLQVKQSHGSEAAATPKESLEMSVRMTHANSAEVILKKSTGAVQKKVTVNGANEAEFHAHMTDAVAAMIKAPNTAAGIAQTVNVASAMVKTHAEVPYSEMVAVLDVLRKNQIVNIGVDPDGSGK
jgi:biopolymer transport protein TolR